MVRRDGSEAAAADRGHDRALRLDPVPRLGVVHRLHELPVSRPYLEGERALPRLGQHRLGIEPKPDLALEPEPVEPARGEHDRVEASLASLAQARVDVAAQRLDREGRVEREQLRLAPHGRGADPHPRAELGRAAQCIPRILAAEIGPDREAVGIRRGQVFRGVNRDVDAPVEQRLLELLDEDATRADLAERTRAVAVAGGRDRDEGKLEAGSPQRQRGRARPG